MGIVVTRIELVFVNTVLEELGTAHIMEKVDGVNVYFDRRKTAMISVEK